MSVFSENTVTSLTCCWIIVMSICHLVIISSGNCAESYPSGKFYEYLSSSNCD